MEYASFALVIITGLGNFSVIWSEAIVLSLLGPFFCALVQARRTLTDCILVKASPSIYPTTWIHEELIM